MVTVSSGNISSSIVGVISSPSATQQVQPLRVQTPLISRLNVPLPQSSGVQLLAPQQQSVVPSSVALSQSAVVSRLVQPASITSMASHAAVSAANGLTPF
jgi:hypothetical protein